MGWSGSNIDILSNPSTVFDGTTSARIKANAGELYQFVDVKPNTEYSLSFYTRWYVPPNSAIDVQILNAVDDSTIATKTLTTNTNWNLIDMEFVTPNDVDEIILLFEKGNEPGWFIDNAVMLEGATLSVYDAEKEQNLKIYPNPTPETMTIKSIQSIRSVVVYSLQGQQLKEFRSINENQFNFDMKDLSKGLYIIETRVQGNKIFIQKIIKK